MSPGGSMFNSFRRRPLEPPSSLTVTTPESSDISVLEREVIERGPEPTNFFSPFSSVERPVPPPIATTRRVACADFSLEGGNAPIVFLLLELGRFAGGYRVRARIGVEQFRKAGIFRQILEIGIIA